MFLLRKRLAGRNWRLIESQKQGSPLTHQADDSADNRPETPRKRTLILREPDIGEVSPVDALDEIDDLPIETYDDIYDDIDDIDDFDAFEVDNGLTDAKPGSNGASKAQSNALQQGGQQRNPSILTWNKASDIGQQANGVRSFEHENDIRPVPLKRISTNQIQQVHQAADHQPEDPNSDDSLKFEKAPPDTTQPMSPDHSRNRENDLLPENVFAETDKLLEATTPVSQAKNSAVDQPKKPLAPAVSKLDGPGFSPSDKPESSEEHIQNVVDPVGASANHPTNGHGLTPPESQTHIEPLLLPSDTSLPKLAPSKDGLPTQIIAEGPRLRRFAAAMIGDEDEADQLVEATLQHAIATPRQLATDFDLSVSLFKILFQKRRDRLRRYDQLLMPSLNSHFSAVLFRRLSGADRDELQEFAEAMSSLGEEDRAILVLISLENFGYREVAKILDIEIDRVMSQIAVAREQLRHALDTMESAVGEMA